MLPNQPQGSRPGSRFEVTLEEGTTLAQLIEERLALPDGFVLVTAIGGQLVELDYVIQDQDHVDLFPPIAGG